MRLVVNGKETQIAGEMSIREFLSSRSIEPLRVGVEHNLRWTRREDWETIVLKENDRLEIIQMMAGG
jgi:sulfur carrier protein